MAERYDFKLTQCLNVSVRLKWWQVTLPNGETQSKGPRGPDMTPGPATTILNLKGVHMTNLG